MKSITEFAGITLNQGLKSKAALEAEGKSAEEVQQGLGEKFKFEGDKLKHFVNAMDVATKNTENLKRVVVIGLAEGESAPAKAVQVEESYYLPELVVLSKPAPAADKDAKGGRGGRGGKGGRDGGKPKGSPWGDAPEVKAAKGSKAPEAKTDKA